MQSFDECAELFAKAQRSLDLEQGPLLRAVLVDGPAGEQRLLLAIHHLVVDGCLAGAAGGPATGLPSVRRGRRTGAAGQDQRLPRLGRTPAGLRRQ